MATKLVNYHRTKLFFGRAYALNLLLTPWCINASPAFFRHPLAFDETMPVARMDGAVAGALGFVRVKLTTLTRPAPPRWYQATAATDYTVHIPIEGLSPDTRYTVRLEGKATEESASAVLTGSFRTPPLDTVVAPVTFTTSTCQYFWSYDDSLAGFKTYQSMLALQPDFLVQTRDYVYYDKPGPLATTPTKARHKWHAMNGWSSLIALFRQVPIYMIKDDHDLLADDVYPTSNPYGQLSYAEGLTIWRENAPVGTPSYRTVRWGQDLQLWLLKEESTVATIKLRIASLKPYWAKIKKHGSPVRWLILMLLLS